MQEWVYPVREGSESWGYDEGVLDMFGGPTAGGRHAWTLSTCFNLIEAGDLIWVRASQPLSRLVGVGVVLDEPKLNPDDGVWYVDICWDRALCRTLVRNVSPSDLLEIRTRTIRRMRTTESARLAEWLGDLSAPELVEMPRGRLRHLQEVTLRQGQGQFRQALLVAYGGRCAISGCETEAALQAAHIQQYDGPATNTVPNGLLLRADLHNLFDAGLIWIDGDRRVRVSDSLRKGHYAELDGQRLHSPADKKDRPNTEALRWHRKNVAWGMK